MDISDTFEYVTATPDQAVLLGSGSLLPPEGIGCSLLPPLDPLVSESTVITTCGHVDIGEIRGHRNGQKPNVSVSHFLLKKVLGGLWFYPDSWWRTEP